MMRERCPICYREVVDTAANSHSMENTMNLAYILTGGFAKGYRTYILAGLAVAGTIAQYAVGDIGLTEALTQGAAALGLGALRAANS